MKLIPVRVAVEQPTKDVNYLYDKPVYLIDGQQQMMQSDLEDLVFRKSHRPIEFGLTNIVDRQGWVKLILTWLFEFGDFEDKSTPQYSEFKNYLVQGVFYCFYELDDHGLNIVPVDPNYRFRVIYTLDCHIEFTNKALNTTVTVKV